MTLSTGEKITNARHERRDRQKLTKTQRELARKQQGLHNRAQPRHTVTCVPARITDRRQEHLHKLTTRDLCQTPPVVLADLNVGGIPSHGTLTRALSAAAYSKYGSMLKDNTA